MQENLDKRLAKGWLMDLLPKKFEELYSKDQLIYLTGDAEETMENFDNK